jgi:2-keto-4-pentenoate hydratase
MGHPAAAVAWLVRALGGRGEALEEGTIVVSGGLTASALLEPHTVVVAEFDGLSPVVARAG